MRRPTAVVGFAMFLAVNLVGCSEQSAPTEAHRMATSESPLMAAAAEHAGAIVGHDSCDPESFNEAIGDPNTCVKPGHTTFQEFIAELQATKVARDWRFNPLEATARRGEAMLAVNVGGEVHTFTPVKKFGGGFIDILNGLSGNPVPAPECLNIPGLDFVASGDRSLIPGAALAAVADANGIARVECCLHPWMRSEVRIR